MSDPDSAAVPGPTITMPKAAPHLGFWALLIGLILGLLTVGIGTQTIAFPYALLVPGVGVGAAVFAVVAVVRTRGGQRLMAVIGLLLSLTPVALVGLYLLVFLLIATGESNR